MGQYWIPVNLDKREYIDPHKLATGLKLREQLANSPGTGAALIVLTTAMPERRGGGDFNEDPIIGRWAGDRIALVGDYAEDSDIPNSPVPASKIHNLCVSEKYRKDLDPEVQELVDKYGWFNDVSEQVCEVIERELYGKYTGTGWRDFTRSD